MKPVSVTQQQKPVSVTQQHRQSCTVFALDPKLHKLGCTCDIGKGIHP